MRRAAALVGAFAVAVAVAGCGGPTAPPAAPTATNEAPPSAVVVAPAPDTVAPDVPDPDAGAGQDNPAVEVAAAVKVLPASSDVTGTYPPVCHTRPAGIEVLPDPGCTPGAVRADVTETDIASNICVRGWTATVRPPQTETGPVKVRSMAAYGEPAAARNTTELDHLVPLELGGSNDTSNLWAEPSDEPGHGFNNSKDNVENELKAAVCAHRVQLSDAQRAIATNWTTAEHVVGIR